MSASDVIAATRHRPTPFVRLDPAAVTAAVARLRAGLPGVSLFYAVKCNPFEPLLDHLAGLGVGFEVASSAELGLAAGLVAPARVACLHPIKTPAFVAELRHRGVTLLAADGPDELDKLFPGSRVLVRVAVSNAGSRLPTAGKFGCPPDAAVRLLESCRGRGSVPLGTTMHVGTQCDDPATWIDAIRTCRGVLGAVPDATTLSLGGGFPARYADAGEVFLPHLPRFAEEGRGEGEGDGVGRRNPLALMAEPGRAVVAEAGVLIATVIGVAVRDGGRWAYLDAGIHQGLFAAHPAGGGFHHAVEVEHPHRPEEPTTLAGPTCDGTDVIRRTILLPRLDIGDRVLFRTAGAYAGVAAAGFNGFPPPAMLWGEDSPRDSP